MSLEPTAIRWPLLDHVVVPKKRSFLGWLGWLLDLFPFFTGPGIISFQPISGPPGTLVTIDGYGFSEQREDNQVEVGNRPAYVITASETRLLVLTDPLVTDGPVKVTVGTQSANGPMNFNVTEFPDAGAGEDGPPINYAGAGAGSPGDVNPIGQVRVLVALVCPNDNVPANPAATRTTVQNAWNNVVTFFDQASYGRTDVQVDITTNWTTLDGATADFVDNSPAVENIINAQLGRIMAQAAQGAVNESLDLDDYTMIACVMFLNGGFIRAWGGWSQQNFAYNNGKPAPDTININLTADHAINLIAIQETADWGRCAHEFGHNVVSAPAFSGDGSATLGEDVYQSDLVDPNAATAHNFEMMGNHDTHPLFSGYHMEKLGYYNADNIKPLDWSRNFFSEEFDVAAHGLSEDTTTSRFHLIKIRIASGLAYYIQVRQRPAGTTQIFDTAIPLGGAPNQGGVIVTAAIADTLNNNQQTRFITLLHPDRVLQQGDFVEDPARALRVTVVNGAVATNPLVCRVKVEWATAVSDDPNGTFDLSLEPWDSSWQSPDVWVDRAPFGTFDKSKDSQGRPQGNGDKPRPMEINRLVGRIHVSGPNGASNVNVTFYSIFPPGVGDNGNWTPLSTQSISSIAANSFVDAQYNWTPVVGQHTCLQIHAGVQLGEVSTGNNFAQENVGEFEAPAKSPPLPAIIRTAVRNPLDERALIRVDVKNVPFGWAVHYPHSWVWLDGRAEKHFDLVVIPLFDYTAFKERKVLMTAETKIEGFAPRDYPTPLANSQPAGSRFYPIGGYTGRVHVCRKASLRLSETRQHDEQSINLFGQVSPVANQQRVRVALTDPKGRLRVIETVTDSAGRFVVSFDLRYEPSLEADPSLWKPAQSVLAGTYSAIASIVAASELSEADSNIVYVQR